MPKASLDGKRLSIQQQRDLLLSVLFQGRSVLMDNGIVKYLLEKKATGSTSSSSGGADILRHGDGSSIIAKFEGSTECIEKPFKQIDDAIAWFFSKQQAGEDQFHMQKCLYCK